MSAGELFLLLLVGHLLGDWVVQTDWQAANKGWKPEEWRGIDVALYGAARHAWFFSMRANQAHCLTYHLTMAAVVLPAWHTRGTAAALAISWVSHGFIDRRWPVRNLLRATGSPVFAEQAWGVIAADQALHLSILAVVAFVAGV